ncbi:UNVERIFIED_CONTAM: hypothetical protein OHV15_06420 [Microbacterium sp. SLM126]
MKPPAVVAGLTLAALAVLASALLTSCAPQERDEVPPLDIEEILASTTEFQADLLKDGTVSPSEYERGLLAQRECVIAAGATPTELYATGNEELTFDYEITAADEAQLALVEEAAGLCLEEYFVDVGRVWAHQQLLTAGERDELQPKVISCLTEAGIEVPADANLEKIASILASNDNYAELAQPCIDAYPGFFFIAPSEGEHEHEHDE